eukprot:GHVN01056435.1.p1 GENE.GHVN01056435.1~~GHVN01056435.1.p1  ORF type:complete len:510 (+),score=78.56 GHVN01056435.1:3172-4701(+)
MPSSSIASTTLPILRQRMTAALWAMYVGDSLSMPVHWYYRPSDIDKHYRNKDTGQTGITRFESPHPQQHPTSIMSLSSKVGQGRRQGDHAPMAKVSIIGDVIQRGRSKFWGPQKQHYHHMLHSGDNTLNLLCMRVLIRSIIFYGCYDSRTWVSSYMSFMQQDWCEGRMRQHGSVGRDDSEKFIAANSTGEVSEPSGEVGGDGLINTPPAIWAIANNDTYCESYHREWWRNYTSRRDGEKSVFTCAGDEGHDTASIGGLISLPVLLMWHLTEPIRKMRSRIATQVNTHDNTPATSVSLSSPNDYKIVIDHLRLSHKSGKLDKSALQFSKFFTNLLNGEDLYSSANLCGQRLGHDLDKLVEHSISTDTPNTSVIGHGKFSSACYIDDALPSVLFLAMKYFHQFASSSGTGRQAASDAFTGSASIDVNGGRSPHSAVYGGNGSMVIEALIANSNVGGDNCHRGAILGAVMGAGASGDELNSFMGSHFIGQLSNYDDIEMEITSFVNACLGGE